MSKTTKTIRRNSKLYRRAIETGTVLSYSLHNNFSGVDCTEWANENLLTDAQRFEAKMWQNLKTGAITLSFHSNKSYTITNVEA